MQASIYQRSLAAARHFLAALSISLLLVTYGWNTTTAYSQTRSAVNTTLVPLPASGTLWVENNRGDIHISLNQRNDLEVTATRHGSGAPALTQEFQVTNKGNKVTITTRPLAAANEVDLKISVPVGTQLRLFSKVGNIDVTGAPGSLIAKTERGNIQLNLPNSINADISISSMLGTVRSNQKLNFTGTPDLRSLYGQLGNGGPVLSAQSEKGQILLTTSADVKDYTATSEPSITVEKVESHQPKIETEPDSSEAKPPVKPQLRQPDTQAQRSQVAEKVIEPAKAQPETVEDNVLKIESQLVTINASVSNNNGQPLINLQQEDFLIYEDRVSQEIVHFQSINTPFNLVLLIDLSGSVRKKIKLIRRAAWHFIQATRVEDRVAIVTFTDRAELVCPLTSNRTELRDGISRIREPEGGTNFYDTLDSTLKWLLRKARGERNAIVIMSDGVDNALPGIPGTGSEISFEEMLAHVEESDVLMFPIYLNTEKEAEDLDDNRAMQSYATARRQLQLLGEVTGGRIFRADRVEDLEGRYEQVAAELRTIYSLGYYPTNNESYGQFRRITVRVKRDDARVRARRGYYAKSR
ncbi:MAG: VWA domain-containing protein [Acidobacteriota bacterium]